MHLFVAILENGRHLGFSIHQSDRIYLITIEMSHANFSACITIGRIHPKNATYLLHCKGPATRNDIVDDIVDDPSSTMDFNVAKIASARASSTISLTKSLRVAGP